MTYYALKLANLKNEQPFVYDMLTVHGAFSVNRTGKQYAGVGIDMCLEQTINADAKSRLKGIISFADISTAVRRWIATGATRTEILNGVMELA